jgi:acyl carrier protein
MMLKDEIGNQVREIIADMLSMKAGDIDETKLLTDYGLNSVDFIDIVVKLESMYKVEFDPATMGGLSCRSLAQNIEAGVTTD